jgi:hypothetical protein
LSICADLQADRDPGSADANASWERGSINEHKYASRVADRGRDVRMSTSFGGPDTHDRQDLPFLAAAPQAKSRHLPAMQVPFPLSIPKSMF